MSGARPQRYSTLALAGWRYDSVIKGNRPLAETVQISLTLGLLSGHARKCKAANQRRLTASSLVCTVQQGPLDSMVPWMTLASWQDITLKGVVQVTLSLRRGKQLTKDLPRWTGACRVENTAVAATHYSQLIMLAGRRVCVVSSQQQEPIRGLRDNRSTVDFEPKQDRAENGRLSSKEARRMRDPVVGNLSQD